MCITCVCLIRAPYTCALYVQDRQLKLLNLIVSNFVPPEEKKKIERRCRYDEDSSEWKVCAPIYIFISELNYLKY